MRLFVLAGFVALVMGGYFYDDIEYYLENELGSSQGGSSSSGLGGAVNNNFRYVDGALGH